MQLLVGNLVNHLVLNEEEVEMEQLQEEWIQLEEEKTEMVMLQLMMMTTEKLI